MPMQFGINTTNTSPASGTEKPAAAGVAGATGVFLGRSAGVVDSPASLLAEAAEALEVPPEDAGADCELEDRKEADDPSDKAEEKLRKAREKDDGEAIEAIKGIEDREGKTLRDRIREYKMLMARDFGPGLAVLRQMLAQGLEREALAARVEELCPDETDAWMVLTELLEEARTNGSSPAVIRAVQDALAVLEGKNAPRILAGLQGALSAQDFPQLGGAASLKDVYRAAACDFTTAMEAFAFIKERFPSDFAKAMDFLFKALSADIASDTPSMGKEHLTSVNGSLGKVRLLFNAHAGCETFLDRWETVHGVTGTRTQGVSGMSLLEHIMRFTAESFLHAGHVEQIALEMRPPDVEHEVLLYQELLAAIREFPVLLFDDAAGRMKVLDAVQESVDKAVQREDEWLENGGGGQDAGA